MELKVQPTTFPEAINFNYEELRAEITERASAYETMVYTEDQLQIAKKDRAALNKFVKALSDERIKVKKECLKPYEDFEKKIKELDGIVSRAIKNIDTQLNEYEEKRKADKLAAIKGYWESCEKPFEIKFEMIAATPWLNASVSLKTVYAEIDARLEQIKTDLATLSNLPEFAFEATEVYKTSLNLIYALNEGHRLSEMQKRKAEVEAEKARQAEVAKFEANVNPPEPQEAPVEVKEEPREWIGFKAHLTVEDAKALAVFFTTRRITFEQIKI